MSLRCCACETKQILPSTMNYVIKIILQFPLRSFLKSLHFKEINESHCWSSCPREAVTFPACGSDPKTKIL